MIGTIFGDIIGSRFEFKIDRHKSKEFELLNEKNIYTDDTVMTLATAKALMDMVGLPKFMIKRKAPEIFIKYYRELGRLYPNAGYGRHFNQWINDDTMGPYNSFGNGAAMRVSPCGIFARTLKEAEMFGELSASVTHNHPEGIKAAKCIAGAVFLAKKGKSKEELKKYVSPYYDIPEDIDKIRENYSFDVSCQGSVPEALMCFFKANSYEDCMRNCVSLGGDTDTMCAIVGTIAEFYFGVPDRYAATALNKLDDNMRNILSDFNFAVKVKLGAKNGETQNTFPAEKPPHRLEIKNFS